MLVYSFPIAAESNDHKLSGLNKYVLIHSPEGWNSKMGYKGAKIKC